MRHRKTRRITVNTFFERRTGTNNRGTLERTVDLILRGLPVTRQEAPEFPQVREMMFVITESKQSKPLQHCWWGFPYLLPRRALSLSRPIRAGRPPRGSTQRAEVGSWTGTARPDGCALAALCGFPASLAQWMQQYTPDSLSTGCPMIRQPQCSHAGAIICMAHSKLSKVPVWLPMETVNVLPSVLPQTSHAPMIPLLFSARSKPQLTACRSLLSRGEGPCGTADASPPGAAWGLCPLTIGVWRGQRMQRQNVSARSGSGALAPRTAARAPRTSPRSAPETDRPDATGRSARRAMRFLRR